MQGSARNVVRWHGSRMIMNSNGNSLPTGALVLAACLVSTVVCCSGTLPVIGLFASAVFLGTLLTCAIVAPTYAYLVRGLPILNQVCPLLVGGAIGILLVFANRTPEALLIYVLIVILLSAIIAYVSPQMESTPNMCPHCKYPRVERASCCPECGAFYR